jgi:hypothetical protein
MLPGQIKRHRLSQQVEAAAKRQPRFLFCARDFVVHASRLQRST